MAKNKSIKPLGDRALLRLMEEEGKEEKTASGIIIPETVKKDEGSTKRGEVVAVGAGRWEEGKRIPLDVKKDDLVLFSWGDKLMVDGEEYYLVTESNILAVIN